MIRSSFFILLATTFSTLELRSQEDHLEPMNSVLHSGSMQAEYFMKLTEAFYSKDDFLHELSMIIDPSFDSQNTLYLHRNDTLEPNRIRIRYYINFAKAQGRIYIKSKAKDGERDTTNPNVGVERKKSLIDTKAAIKLKELYSTVLLQVSPNRKPISGFDGIHYYFYSKGINIRSGTTWSPRKGTKMGELVEISETIISLVRNHRGKTAIKFDNSLLERIDNLVQRIQSED